MMFKLNKDKDQILSINQNFKEIKIIDEIEKKSVEECGMSIDFNGKFLIIKSLISVKNQGKLNYKENRNTYIKEFYFHLILKNF